MNLYDVAFGLLLGLACSSLAASVWLAGVLQQSARVTQLLAGIVKDRRDEEREKGEADWWRTGGPEPE